MSNRYWEGHRDGGADMRERCDEWRKKDRVALEQLQADHKELRKRYTEVSDRAYKRLSELRTAQDRIEQLESEPTYRIRQEQAERIELLEIAVNGARMAFFQDGDKRGAELMSEALESAGDTPPAKGNGACPNCGMISFNTKLTIHEAGCPLSVPDSGL